MIVYGQLPEFELIVDNRDDWQTLAHKIFANGMQPHFVMNRTGAKL
jgi:hypothetical protein